MSGQPSGNPPPRSGGNGSISGPSSGPLPTASRPNDNSLGSSVGGNGQNGTMSQQNLNQIVIEYLSKKGYTRTEAMLRTESANQDADGRPLHTRLEDTGGQKYTRAFVMLQVWIEQNLDIYKPELRRLLWPMFVYSYLNLVSEFFTADARSYFERFQGIFENEHAEDLRKLQPVSLPEQAQDAEIAKLYYGSKYRLTLSTVGFFNLILFLEGRHKEGGALLIGILQTYCNVVTIDRASDDKHSLAQMLGRTKVTEDFPAEDEGIPGHNPGSANTDQNAGSTVLTRLKLGPLPMEPELLSDVMAELEERDIKYPPAEGKNSLVEEFQHIIKREESEEAPNAADLPLPPSLMRDVVMEVQKVKENRDRFKIEGRTGGVGAGVSVSMFTFHNTYDGINCIDISGDNSLVAAGMSEHYIRVWNLEGRALPSIIPGDQPAASRRLIGHSAPVYQVSFSPAINSTKPHDHNPKGPSTAPRYLLSCSADHSIRLWLIDTWTCLVAYKGHMGPVWDVQWGPFGHYFLTGSYDRTARLWSTENIAALRLFVGHDADVDVVAFHPNNIYVFSGSSDKSVRMWAVTNGYCVRMFTGHTGNITTMKCSHNGKLLATGDDKGTIIIWDLAPGKLLKRMRGHGRGGIWSIDWSAESSVLVSSGMDGTVRLWDAAPGEGTDKGKVVGEGGAGVKVNVDGQQVPAGGSKKKGKEEVVSPDQISAFPTKKSPVYKVKFTRMNLVIAAGAYLP